MSCVLYSLWIFLVEVMCWIIESETKVRIGWLHVYVSTID